MFIKNTLALIMLAAALFLVGGCSLKSSQAPPPQPPGETDQTASQSDKLLVVTGEYAPYTSETLPNNGVLTEIITAVLNDTGLDYEIRFYPWARGSEMVKNGQAWASFPYGYQDKLTRDYGYSDPLISSRHLFYYLSTNQQLAGAGQSFRRLSDFAGYTFGGTNDYWYGTKKDLDAQGVTAEWASDTDALIKMLHAGRIDFFIEDEQVADTAIARLFPNETHVFAKLPNVAAKRDYYLLISKTYPHAAEITEKFNASLQKLKENGEINRILTENGIPVS